MASDRVGISLCNEFAFDLLPVIGAGHVSDIASAEPLAGPGIAPLDAERRPAPRKLFRPDPPAEYIRRIRFELEFLLQENIIIRIFAGIDKPRRTVAPCAGYDLPASRIQVLPMRRSFLETGILNQIFCGLFFDALIIHQFVSMQGDCGKEDRQKQFHLIFSPVFSMFSSEWRGMFPPVSSQADRGELS